MTLLTGKLPPDLLAHLLGEVRIDDPRVLVGPRPGEDCAVLDMGDMALLAKTDPITFATDEIGWYAVHVNANDIAATGGTPAWFMATILLPDDQAEPALIKAIFRQIRSACDSLSITLIGGHTEITHGIDRPIVMGAMLGTAPKDAVVTTGGAQPGDVIMVTKGVPVEATAIIAREKGDTLDLPADFVERCANYLYEPGISVVEDARIAQQAGRIHAMHDPTEGGLATGLWEMAEASGMQFVVEPDLAIDSDGQRICDAVDIDPLGAIASGALLFAVHPDDADAVTSALAEAGISTYRLGMAQSGEGVVSPTGDVLTRPERDEIAKLF